ncbi:c-di-GMP phosphodiesterase [Pararobbsia alpina]
MQSRSARLDNSSDNIRGALPLLARVKSISSDSESRGAHGDARRSRLVLRVACALLTVAAFVLLGVWQAREEIAERRIDVARDVITSVESMIDRVSAEHGRIMPLVGTPCDVARLRLATSDAFIPYIRSGALVKNGLIYCVSSYGPNTVRLSTYLGEVARDRPSYRLVSGTVAQPTRATLLVFFPAPTPDPLGSGVLFYIDGAYLADVLREDTRFGMDHIALRNAQSTLTLSGVSAASGAREPATAASDRFPLDVVVHESPVFVRDVYRHQLSVFVPIGFAFAGMIAWLMSISFDPRRLLLRAVRTGIERREFEVHYQPVVDLERGTCVGVEALVRWSHPRWGTVSPGEFIGIVEDDPLIAPMTHMIVERALEELHIHRIPANLHLAVNLAPRHLQDRRAIADLSRLLRTRARGRGVIAEVTERQLFDDRAAALASFELLRQHGVRFALDDFGTDRSTLGQLQAFHFDFLKIDQRFVSELEHDRTDLIRGIVALARQIGLTLIAEGIETTRQHQRLLDLGVEYGQGYLHGSPMSATQLAHWLTLGPRRVHARVGAEPSPGMTSPRSGVAAPPSGTDPAPPRPRDA